MDEKNIDLLVNFPWQVAVMCICLFVILPLTLVGTIVGRALAGQPNFPCRVNAVPRPIPEKKWFMEPAVIVLLGGVLPFGSIFIEMWELYSFIHLLDYIEQLHYWATTQMSLHSVSIGYIRNYTKLLLTLLL